MSAGNETGETDMQTTASIRDQLIAAAVAATEFANLHPDSPEAQHLANLAGDAAQAARLLASH